MKKRLGLVLVVLAVVMSSIVGRTHAAITGHGLPWSLYGGGAGHRFYDNGAFRSSQAFSISLSISPNFSLAPEHFGDTTVILEDQHSGKILAVRPTFDVGGGPSNLNSKYITMPKSTCAHGCELYVDSTDITWYLIVYAGKTAPML